MVNSCDLVDFEVVSELFISNTIYIVNDDIDNYTIAYIYINILHNSNDDELRELTFLDDSEIEACRNISSAISALKNYDINSATNSIIDIYNLNSGSSKYDKIIHHLEQLTDINKLIANNIIHASVYGNITRKEWWLERPNLDNVLNDIMTHVSKFPTDIQSKLNAKVKCFHDLVAITSKKDIVDNFKLLSAFCYAFVPYYINNNQYITAYLLIHRSLDLYFTSEAISNGKILVKARNLTYHNRSASSEDDFIPRIHLYSTYFDYVAKYDKLDLDKENTIKRVNKKRNELLYTHGVDAVSNKEVNEEYQKVNEIMRNDKFWKEQLSNFKSRMVVDTKDIIYDAFDIKGILWEYKSSQ